MSQSAVDLLVSYGWKSQDARVGIRAKFHCEYCDKYLLESALTFYEWHRDHIVPVSAGGSEDDDNIAAACWHCNMKFKGSWDPRPFCHAHASRSELISAIRSHCNTAREAKDREVAFVRDALKGLGIELG